MKNLPNFDQKGVVSVYSLLALLAMVGLVNFLILTSANSAKNRKLESTDSATIATHKKDHPSTASSSASPTIFPSAMKLNTYRLEPAELSSGNRGEEIKVSLRVRSDPANLFAVKINFSPAFLEVDSIDATGSFVTNWIDKSSENDSGKVSLIGGIVNGFPNKGFSSGEEGAIMAAINFKIKENLDGKITNLTIDPSSAIYSNTTNENILQR